MAKSTADAEFNYIAVAAEEGIWLEKVQTELYPAKYTKNVYPNIKLYNDNQACIASPTNGHFWASMRHIVAHYF